MVRRPSRMPSVAEITFSTTVPKGETPSSFRSAWRAAAIARRLSSTASALLEQVLELLGEIADGAHLGQHVQGDRHVEPAFGGQQDLHRLDRVQTHVVQEICPLLQRPALRVRLEKLAGLRPDTSC